MRSWDPYPVCQETHIPLKTDNPGKISFAKIKHLQTEFYLVAPDCFFASNPAIHKARPWKQLKYAFLLGKSIGVCHSFSLFAVTLLGAGVV